MTIIYRLETSDGVGVYQTAATGIIDFDRQNHPMPQDDSLLMNNLGALSITDFHFGFTTLQQLRSWFYKDEWFISMSEEGIVLSIYDATEAFKGFSQAVFNRYTARLIAQNKLIEFFKLPV